MRAISAADLITELDATIAKSSSERCARMLWRTTELLVDGNHRLQEPQVGLLDDVLIRLARRIAPRDARRAQHDACRAGVLLR